MLETKLVTATSACITHWLAPGTSLADAHRADEVRGLVVRDRHPPGCRGGRERQLARADRGAAGGLLATGHVGGAVGRGLLGVVRLRRRGALRRRGRRGAARGGRLRLVRVTQAERQDDHQRDHTQHGDTGDDQPGRLRAWPARRWSGRVRPGLASRGEPAGRVGGTAAAGRRRREAGKDRCHPGGYAVRAALRLVPLGIPPCGWPPQYGPWPYGFVP